MVKDSCADFRLQYTTHTGNPVLPASSVAAVGKFRTEKDVQRIAVGWREWVALPELGVSRIKAKIDSGARTSCIHAFCLETFTRNHSRWVRFGIHPEQKNRAREIFCESPVIDERMVTDSGGHRENRLVIQTRLQLPGTGWPIEITLTNRDNMSFRMLLGRSAMKGRMIVHPDRSFLLETQSPASAKQSRQQSNSRRS